MSKKLKKQLKDLQQRVELNQTIMVACIKEMGLPKEKFFAIVDQVIHEQTDEIIRDLLEKHLGGKVVRIDDLAAAEHIPQEIKDALQRKLDEIQGAPDVKH